MAQALEGKGGEWGVMELGLAWWHLSPKFVNKQLAVTVGIEKLGGAKGGLKTFLVFHIIE